MDAVHVPVLLDEVVELFRPLEGALRICDATLGGGGHTARLLELCRECTIAAIDADGEMIERARQRLGDQPRLTIAHGWFDEAITDRQPYDRILIDLGVSMVHLRVADRGFSLREEGPLDMRLDRSGSAPTAAELLTRINERDLADLIFTYGEERYARRIARAVVSYRPAALASTAAFADCIRGAVPAAYRHGRLHPATRTFQAVRIAVNDELARVERVIPAAINALAPGGRLAMISFHSLEDRIVKHRFRAAAAENPDLELVTKRPVMPSDGEIARNPAARSARLRVIARVSGSPVDRAARTSERGRDA